MVTNVNPLNGFCNGPNCLPISASVGIVLRGSDFAMKDNNIHEVPYPIVLIDNDSDGSYMLRNTSMNSDISVMAFGDNTGVQLKCNNLMDYNLFGIFINGYSITGEAGDLGAQGDCGINDFPSNVFSPSNGTAYDIFFTNNTNTLYYEDVVLPTSIGGNTANFNGVLCTPPIGFNTNIYCNNLVLKPLDEIDDLVSEDAKNKALSEWIFEYVKDSNFIAIKDLILSQNTLMTERKRIPEKLIEAELDVAQILLDQMLVSKEEDHWYKQYYQLMLDVQQAERSVFELTEDELVLLENIANSRTKTAFKAQALLFIIQGKIFLVDLPELPDGTLLQTVFKTETNLSQLSEEEKIFNVFPNPVKDQITLDFNKVKNGKIQLIDVLGKTVLMKNIYESKQEILDVSMLGIGIYFIQIQLDNKEIAIQKIIINR